MSPLRTSALGGTASKCQNLAGEESFLTFLCSIYVIISFFSKQKYCLAPAKALPLVWRSLQSCPLCPWLPPLLGPPPSASAGSLPRRSGEDWEYRRWSPGLGWGHEQVLVRGYNTFWGSEVRVMAAVINTVSSRPSVSFTTGPSPPPPAEW